MGKPVTEKKPTLDEFLMEHPQPVGGRTCWVCHGGPGGGPIPERPIVDRRLTATDGSAVSAAHMARWLVARGYAGVSEDRIKRHRRKCLGVRSSS
jgi:hypothetical protein